MTGLTSAELAAVAGVLREAGVAPAGDLRADLIAGGRSNLTFRLSDGVSRWVLRMPPRAGRTPSAHDVAREFRVTRALAGAGVPVARAVALCEDESLLGGPFAVAEFVEGRSIQHRSDLEALTDPLLERAVTRMVEALAKLHQVDHVAVGLGDFGRADGYAARQLRRWSGQWPLVTRGDAAVDELAEQLRAALAAEVPDQQAVGIVHGDYRIDNTLLRIGDADVDVAAIVDWELSTVGDPVADVAMMCVYRHPALDHILGAPSAWTSDRLPSVRELADDYRSAGGVPLDEWDYHLALGYYKLAVIAAGIDYRYREGVGEGPGFDSSYRAVPELLVAGLEAIR
ncbi:acyl-CoA dehydrogenase [Nocardioides flavus (ex Wang et al. 2016)]|uniref:Acyl-CoA dehydrogenase n=1 Tax=Nocardioides flavus (ex Wang et al. 2016) TaxID=2058780 RepID=A0ABQ3HJ68_9ACTN|nr:phosphotransferase family protein [Nocardioides flavus (ex Wang et al. 2016)]GHE16741.1 acyl-CoA dehydrogenase [Nocardioides flavus (ex Wang et al. 2016)]